MPAWCDKPEEDDPSTLSVILEPGLAFGTGEHPTTRLCLGWLKTNIGDVKDRYVMDFGTGSGVLAIGALLMGARKSVGVDIDPLSVRSSKLNAALNGEAQSPGSRSDHMGVHKPRVLWVPVHEIVSKEHAGQAGSSCP